MSTDERIMKEAVAEANAWRVRAEQAEALVGRLASALRKARWRNLESVNLAEIDAALDLAEADPTGARLAEEQRALNIWYVLSREDHPRRPLGYDRDAWPCDKCDALDAVERARGGQG